MTTLSLSRPTETPGPGDPRHGTAPAPSWWQRIWWILVGCALVNWSVQILGAATSFTWVGVLVVLGGAWGLGTVVVAALPAPQVKRSGAMSEVAAWLTALVLMVMFVAWSYVQVRNSPGYGTDELAFDQYAGMLARHGLNPYTHSMAPAFAAFQVSPDGYSYTLAGHAVTQLSYPALAFLVYVPFLMLGLSSQLAVVVNVLAWALTVLLLFTLLPRQLRAAALVLGSIGVYVSYAVGGVTDVIYMPLLVLAAYRWDRYGSSRWSYLGPVMFGLAMAVKQTPWLLLPFIVCGLAADEYLRSGPGAAVRRSGSYLLIAVGAFLVPNLGYIVASPSAWLHGILIPITSDLVPAGQGAIGLTLFSRIGGGSLVAFSAATGLLALVLLLAYVAGHPWLRPATFVFPSIVLFFSSRSYGSYLVSLVPVVMVGVMTIAPASQLAQTDTITAPAGRPGRRRWGLRWAVAVGAAATGFVGVLVYALTSGSPLAVRIAGLRTTGQLATIQQITLEVTNRSSKPVRPAFTLDEGGQVTTFWLVTHGPRLLGAHRSTRYTIVAPNFPAQPPIGGGFSVLAFTRSPAAVSATAPYNPSSLHVALVPAAINRNVPVGQRIAVTAELLNDLDEPVSRANVPIYLGQVIYDQAGLVYGEARINAGNPGQTPVRAYTNDDGVAHFTITGTQRDSEPVYFEANLVNALNFYPYGYSDILPIRFSQA